MGPRHNSHRPYPPSHRLHTSYGRTEHTNIRCQGVYLLTWRVHADTSGYTASDYLWWEEVRYNRRAVQFTRKITFVVGLFYRIFCFRFRFFIAYFLWFVFSSLRCSMAVCCYCTSENKVTERKRARERKKERKRVKSRTKWDRRPTLRSTEKQQQKRKKYNWRA